MDPTDMGVKEDVTSSPPSETGCRMARFGLYSGVLSRDPKTLMNRQLAQRKAASARRARRERQSPGGRFFPFLRRLRAAGRSNMYGAIPYLMRTFALDRETAFRVVCEWEDAQAAERPEAGEAPRRR